MLQLQGAPGLQACLEDTVSLKPSEDRTSAQMILLLHHPMCTSRFRRLEEEKGRSAADKRNKDARELAT